MVVYFSRGSGRALLDPSMVWGGAQVEIELSAF